MDASWIRSCKFLMMIIRDFCEQDHPPYLPRDDDHLDEKCQNLYS